MEEKNLSTQKQVFGLAQSDEEKTIFCLTCGMTLQDLTDQMKNGKTLDEIYNLLHSELKDRRVTRDSMAITETVVNALEELKIDVRNNLLTGETEVTGLPEAYSGNNALNGLPTCLQDFFKTRGVKGFTKQRIEDCLALIADFNRYNPIIDFLCSARWDGVDRLSKLYDIMGITRPLYQTYVKKWLVQCVALALNDEKEPIGAEGVLVLQGPQGCGKTSFFRKITPNPHWFVEGAAIDTDNKDTMLNALSGWITELGELDGTLKKEQVALKAFITQTTDRIRPPYGKNLISTPRRTSFCGTVNREDYLRDETGSRRFWTIPITEIDKKRLFALSSDFINQLWLQAYELYLQNSNGFRLSDEELKTVQEDNKAFTVALPYEMEIEEKLNYNIPFDKWEWWRAAELAEYHFFGKDARQIGRALNKISENLEKHKPKDKANQRMTRTIDGYQNYYLPLKHRAGWIYPKN